MNETFGLVLTVAGFILFAYLIASCSWADRPRPENDNEPWDTQI